MPYFQIINSSIQHPSTFQSQRDHKPNILQGNPLKHSPTYKYMTINTLYQKYTVRTKQNPPFSPQKWFILTSFQLILTQYLQTIPHPHKKRNQKINPNSKQQIPKTSKKRLPPLPLINHRPSKRLPALYPKEIIDLLSTPFDECIDLGFCVLDYFVVGLFGEWKYFFVDG